MIKQGDFAMLVLVTAISMVVAYLVSGALINSPDSRSTPVEITIPMSAEFAEPDSEIFNDNAINPTELIEIGDANTTSPFQGN